MPIGLVIGAGSWGLAEPDQARDFAAAIRKYRSIISTIDTAALYPLPNPGASEKAIGEAGFADEGYVINTKALYLPQGGCYNAEGVQRSVSQSLQSLKIAKVSRHCL
jgi:aflatoxin B1 aldehyde reductase